MKISNKARGTTKAWWDSEEKQQLSTKSVWVQRRRRRTLNTRAQERFAGRDRKGTRNQKVAFHREPFHEPGAKTR